MKKSLVCSRKEKDIHLHSHSILWFPYTHTKTTPHLADPLQNLVVDEEQENEPHEEVCGYNTAISGHQLSDAVHEPSSALEEERGREKLGRCTGGGESRRAR